MCKTSFSTKAKLQRHEDSKMHQLNVKRAKRNSIKNLKDTMSSDDENLFIKIDVDKESSLPQIAKVEGNAECNTPEEINNQKGDTEDLDSEDLDDISIAESDDYNYDGLTANKENVNKNNNLNINDKIEITPIRAEDYFKLDLEDKPKADLEPDSDDDFNDIIEDESSDNDYMDLDIDK